MLRQRIAVAYVFFYLVFIRQIQLKAYEETYYFSSGNCQETNHLHSKYKEQQERE